MATFSLTPRRGTRRSGATSIAPACSSCLKINGVLYVLARRHPDRRDRLADGRVTEDVVGTGRLLDPVQVEAVERVHPGDGLVDAPDLVGVDGDRQVGADGLTGDAQPAQVVLLARRRP